jgi:hypothetical protein
LQPHKHPAVDEEGRRSGDARPESLLDVLVDLCLKRLAVETRGKCCAVELELLGVLLQLVRRMTGRAFIKKVVVFPANLAKGSFTPVAR